MNEANTGWLDETACRCPRILPPNVDLSAIRFRRVEEAGERSLARLGLRAQQRYNIPAAEWRHRWSSVAV